MNSPAAQQGFQDGWYAVLEKVAQDGKPPYSGYDPSHTLDQQLAGGLVSKYGDKIKGLIGGAQAARSASNISGLLGPLMGISSAGHQLGAEKLYEPFHAAINLAQDAWSPKSRSLWPGSPSGTGFDELAQAKDQISEALGKLGDGARSFFHYGDRKPWPFKD